MAFATLVRQGRIEPLELRRRLDAEAPAELAADDVRRINWKLVARSLQRRLAREYPAAAAAFAGLDDAFAVY